MIQHYSKVALRNLMKYKTQNLISVFVSIVAAICRVLTNVLIIIIVW